MNAETNIDIPEVIILSTQRSGTHLLESFLKCHHKINGRGEVFLRYERQGAVGENLKDRVNVGILMYNQIATFESLGGNLERCKIIHLIRNANDVALSRCQMRADKKVLGSSYSAHMLKSSEPDESLSVLERPRPDIVKLKQEAGAIRQQQLLFSSLVQHIPHVEIRYEDLVPEDQTVSAMKESMSADLLNFIGLEDTGRLTTPLIKTGVKV